MNALKALVVGMGILILLGVAVIGVTIYRRAEDPQPTASGATAPPMAMRKATEGRAFGVRDMALPPGTELIAVFGAGERVVVHLRAADGQVRLLVLDPASGTQLGEWRLGHDPAAASAPAAPVPGP